MEGLLPTDVPLLMLFWMACAGGLAGIEPHGAVVQADPQPVVLGPWALVGETPSPPPTGFVADVAEVARQVVLVGDAVEAAHPDAWSRVGTRWEALPVLPLRGEGERRADPRGKRFEALWPGASSWGRIDVGPHRVVWLDPGDPVDQRFWLPGALSRPVGGVVVLLPEGADEVQRQVLEAVPPSALALVVVGGAEGNRARLSQGRWGPMELAVGPVDGGVLVPLPGTDGFHAAHREVLARELPASSWALQPDATLRDALAPGGWWALDVGEEGIHLALRRRGNDGQWRASYRARWTRDGGWEEQGATSFPSSASTPTVP